MLFRSVKEIYDKGGYWTWIDLRNRMKRHSTFYAFLCESMGKLIEMNDKAGGMIGGQIVGNRQSPPLYIINIAEGIDLMRYDIKEISDIFAKDQYSGKIKNEDREYINWRERDKQLIVKCKKLRQEIAKKSDIEYSSVTLREMIKSKKPSELYRKMERASIKKEIKVPPSYRTRIRDGISVPAPKIFMGGYNKLFRMGLTSKTLENSFLILNRQSWTRQKGFISRIGGGDGKCQLCGEIESTAHLVYECEEYSEIIWTVLGRILSNIYSKSVFLHGYNVMYNLELKNLNSKENETINLIIQEIKRNIIYRAMLREKHPRLNEIIYNDTKIAAHLLIIFQKIKARRLYTKKGLGEIEKIVNYAEQLIE